MLRDQVNESRILELNLRNLNLSLEGDGNRLRANHDILISFVIPGTNFLEKNVVIPETWNASDFYIT